MGDGAFPAGSAIGNWRVLDRGETWAILGEDMGILTYRLLYRWVAEDTVDAESTLMWKTRFGKFYWLLAGPMHQRLLPRMMRNAVNGEGSTTQLA